MKFPIFLMVFWGLPGNSHQSYFGWRSTKHRQPQPHPRKLLLRWLSTAGPFTCRCPLCNKNKTAIFGLESTRLNHIDINSKEKCLEQTVCVQQQLGYKHDKSLKTQGLLVWVDTTTFRQSLDLHCFDAEGTSYKKYSSQMVLKDGIFYNSTKLKNHKI